MKATTTADVRDLLAGYLTAGALGAALERQLFWQLGEQPEAAESIAGRLDIPLNRCRYWLDVLVGLGLLDRHEGGYATSAAARSLIMDVYGAETWALLATEVRERFRAGNHLVRHLSHAGSVWDIDGDAPPDYVAQMVRTPERARRFTRMLYEIHAPVANQLARTLDLAGVRRLLDLGGGSGVMSIALLRRDPDLTAVVVDIANVCAAGREIAAETPVAQRITYHPADFVADPLPEGFDLALECDVGIYDEVLFRKLWAVLNPGGRVVILDDFAPPGSETLPLWQARHALYRSLADPEYTWPTVDGVHSLLSRAGFEPASEQVLESGAVVLVARKAEPA
jgi:SAM-dependent methyltransferase